MKKEKDSSKAPKEKFCSLLGEYHLEILEPSRWVTDGEGCHLRRFDTNTLGMFGGFWPAVAVYKGRMLLGIFIIPNQSCCIKHPVSRFVLLEGNGTSQ